MSGADAAALDDGAELTFEYDGMLAFIFQHPSTDELVIDVEVFQLSEPRMESANLERLLLLHQLNGITRFTHGAQALVSVDNMLMVTRSHSLEGMSGQQLTLALDQMLDVAGDLRSMWSDLRSLITQAGQSLDAGGVLDVVIDPAQFA